MLSQLTAYHSRNPAPCGHRRLTICHIKFTHLYAVVSVKFYKSKNLRMLQQRSWLNVGYPLQWAMPEMPDPRPGFPSQTRGATKPCPLLRPQAKFYRLLSSYTSTPRTVSFLILSSVPSSVTLVACPHYYSLRVIRRSCVMKSYMRRLTFEVFMIFAKEDRSPGLTRLHILTNTLSQTKHEHYTRPSLI